MPSARLALLLLAVAGCGGDTGTSADPEAVRAGLLAIVAQDARLAQQTPLQPGDYDALAEKLGAVPGVDAAEYAGDTLGTIYVQVHGEGIMVYRHIKNGWNEIDTLPAAADFSAQLHPDYNAGWATTPVDWPAKAPAAQENTFFTHFPVATLNPDPTWSMDASLSCPAEGKIALVDFQYTAMGGNERDAMTSDGVMLYDRVRAMADAAGFQFDFYPDGAINSTNFDKLEDYTVVIVIAHGTMPNPRTAQRVKVAMPGMMTPEIYDGEKKIVGGMTMHQAWREGLFLRDVEEYKSPIDWTPRLFQNLYHPSVPQLFMINTCWGLLTKNDQGFGRNADNSYSWGKKATFQIYNFGDGLMDAGVKVVFGYVTPASPMAILENTMTFFRRMYGGYFSGDRPPARFPQRYWPTCMGAQTYFRRPDTPDQKLYANKERGGTIYTMYAVDQNQYFRDVCAQGNQHAMLQDFTFSVGAPASSFLGCWDQWWSQGLDPTFVQDAYCSKGDPAASEEQTGLAACAVKVARKVTNVMLE